MFEKRVKIVFVAAFFVILVLPMLFVNTRKGKVSEAEKRKLAAFPVLWEKDGTVNEKYAADFETWLNDNIGFRSQMVVANAYVQYYVFDQLANNTDMYLGPNGELNYATAKMLADYQHFTLYSENEKAEIADSFAYINDYVHKMGADFIYYQCWDKHSIYPEQFPKGVLQYGDVSRADELVEAIRSSGVKVIDSKQALIAGKNEYDTYTVWGDPTHWSERGAYIGYKLLMEGINEKTGGSYRTLSEDDYEISVIDQGEKVFGGIHREQPEEHFEIKDPKAVATLDKLVLYGDDNRFRYFTNDKAGNDTRLLIIGDSYFKSYIVEDVAESFGETILLYGGKKFDLKKMLDTYKPDIVVLESAERNNYAPWVIDSVKKMRGE